EGVRLRKGPAPVTYPPQLTRRQPREMALLWRLRRSRALPVQKGFSAMNFRILAGSVGPRGRLFALLAATTLVVPAAFDALAQAPAPAPGAPKAKAAPKGAPKGPAAPSAQAPAAPPAQPAPGAQAQAPNGQGQPQQDQVQLIYAPWTKFCLKG